MGDVSSLEPLQNREAIYSREGGEVLQNGDALNAQNGNEDQYNNFDISQVKLGTFFLTPPICFTMSKFAGLP